jgi:hypothetical protein
MKKLKIAIIGSCASRDNFNSMFIPHYKDFYNCVFHQNQMSMISLVSQPIPYEASKIDGPLSPHDKRQFQTELEKSAYAHLIINQPDYLILDFYADVLMGIRKIGDSYITNKRWKFSQTTLYSELHEGNEITINKNPENYLRLWKESVDSFFEFANTYLPKCKVIVHKARFTDEYLDESSGEVKKLNDKITSIDTKTCNKWWDIFDNYIIENYNVRKIDYKNNYLASESHPWGLFQLHFEDAFYKDFTNQLLSIIVNDLKSELDSIEVNDINTKLPNYIPDFNLILNPTFNFGNSFWSEWNDSFSIVESEQDKPNSKIVNINRIGLTKDSIASLWSNLIEINADGETTFTLSFDMKISDMETFDSHQAFFCVRTFDKTDQFSQKDAVWFRYFKLQEIAVEEGEWCRYTFEIKPFAGKYIRVGPYMFQNGNVSWRELQLK